LVAPEVPELPELLELPEPPAKGSPLPPLAGVVEATALPDPELELEPEPVTVAIVVGVCDEPKAVFVPEVTDAAGVGDGDAEEAAEEAAEDEELGAAVPSIVPKP
jgi:hypothetical protein